MLKPENHKILKSLPIYGKVAFEFSDGWTNLIYTLGKNITIYCETRGIDLPQIRQIKEKFGSLRFYYGGTRDDTINIMVREAELKSETTCEICGENGRILVSDGKWYTACPKHTIEGSQTPKEFAVIRETQLNAQRRCNFCDNKGAVNYFDTATKKLVCACNEHKTDDFITAEEYFDNREKYDV